MKYYLRFGNIPENKISQIHRGDSKFNQQCNGVSVWNCTEVNGIYFPILPSNPTETTYADYFYCLLGDKPIYLVYGTEVGIGAVGEPLLGKDIQIEKEITEDYNYIKSILSSKKNL